MTTLVAIVFAASAVGLLGYWLWLVSLARRQIGLCRELIACWQSMPASVRTPLPGLDMPGTAGSLLFPKRSFLRALDWARETVAAMTAKRSYPGALESDELAKILEREEALCARTLLSFSTGIGRSHYGPNGLNGIGTNGYYCGTCEGNLTMVEGGIIGGEPLQVFWCRRCMSLGSKRLASRAA